MSQNISIKKAGRKYEISYYEIPLFSDQLAGIFGKNTQIISDVDQHCRILETL